MNIQKKLKVFLIEDAAKIRSILIEILHQTGQIEVVGFAESERDALQQLRSREWDVAIVDIGLREGTGLGVLKGLKSDGKAYGKPLLRIGHWLLEQMDFLIRLEIWMHWYLNFRPWCIGMKEACSPVKLNIVKIFLFDKVIFHGIVS
jgi:hypothetical protein